MMRESQYIDAYLWTNAERGYGYGLTPETFLRYRLRGRARFYGAGYTRALVRAIERRHAAGSIIAGPSVNGRTAYYPAVIVRTATEHALASMGD